MQPESHLPSIPSVSVRRGGIRWPKRRHFIRRDPGLFVKWKVVVEELGTGRQEVEARFTRRRTAERIVRLLNRVETDAFNS